MSTKTVHIAHVSSTDRLIFTLFMSIALNAAIILGITFAPPSFFNKDESEFSTIDVTLVDSHEQEQDVESDLYAQANQSGSGNTDDPSRPSTVQSATPLPVPISGESEILQPNQSTDTAISAVERDMLTSFDSPDSVVTEEDTSEDASEQPSAAELLALGREIARLSAEIDQSTAIYSNKPNEKHRFVAANTKAFRDAAYLDSWRKKIERVGNLNYPDEAKRSHLSGNLTMDVAINHDGTIRTINILKSSGHKLLDDAAVRIVRLSAPFAPLPPEMRKDTDVLHITRSWQFLSGNRLSTQ